MVWDRGTWTPDDDPHKGMQKGHLDFELHGEKLQRPLASRAHAQAPGRAAGAVAADQRHRRIRRARNPIPTFSKRCRTRAATGRTIDEIAADKKRGLAFQPRRQGSAQGGQSRGAEARPSPARAKPRPDASAARRRSRRDAGKKSRKSPARARPLTGLHPAVPRDAERQGARQRRLGPRDQVRRLPHPGADRRRQGHAEDTHRPRLDGEIPRRRRRLRRARRPRRHPRRRDRLDRRERRLGISPRCRTT